MLFSGLRRQVLAADPHSVMSANHRPFGWGPKVRAAAGNAVKLETTAGIAYCSLATSQDARVIAQFGDKRCAEDEANASYGQPGNSA